MAKAGKTPKVKTGKQKPVKEKKAAAKKAAAKTPAAKKVSGKKVKEKSEVSFFRSIRFRLIASFMIPVVCIIVLGYVSYAKASEAIVNSYKNSTEQTADMMQQYISLIVTSEKDEFKSYLNEEDMRNYINGLFSAEVNATTKKSYSDEITAKIALDTKIKSIFFLIDEGKSIYVANAALPDDAYTSYISSAQGAEIEENHFDWFVYGQNAEADATINIDSSSYALRLARRMNDTKAVMLINLDSSFIRKAMLSLDPGEGGYVALVSADGAEFFSDSTVELDEPIIYGTDFYQKALDGEDSSGNMEVEIYGENYLFVFSKLETGNVIIAALIPESVILAETADIKQMSVLLTLVAAVIALLLGMLISRGMSGTIQYILRQLRKVSKGDLTVRLTGKKKDEFGLLCEGINGTVEHVKGLIVHVNEVSTQLNEAAAYVSEASSTLWKPPRISRTRCLRLKSV